MYKTSIIVAVVGILTVAVMTNTLEEQAYGLQVGSGFNFVSERGSHIHQDANGGNAKGGDGGNASGGNACNFKCSASGS